LKARNASENQVRAASEKKPVRTPTSVRWHGSGKISPRNRCWYRWVCLKKRLAAVPRRGVLRTWHFRAFLCYSGK